MTSPGLLAPAGLLTPDADEARRLLEEELARQVYVDAEPGIVERAITAVLRALARLLDGLGGLGAGPGTVVLAIGAVLVIVVAILLIRPRLNARGRAQDAPVFEDGTGHSAAEHRARAAALGDEGNWNDAVAESFRALIRSAEERVLVDEQRGRTATEAASQVGTVLADLAPGITSLAELFNETQYGSGRATAADHRDAVALELRVSSTSPSHAAHAADMTSPVAPR